MAVHFSPLRLPQERRDLIHSRTRKYGGRKPAVIADAMVDPSLGTAESVIALRLRSVMCAPLIASGEAFPVRIEVAAAPETPVEDWIPITCKIGSVAALHVRVIERIEGPAHDD